MTEITQADRELFIATLNPCDSVAESVRKGTSFTWEVQQIARHREQAAAEERAKIVAWLREQAGPKEMLLFNETAWVLADCIEADEHKTFTRSGDV